jgi:predicted  nucleic acid-binding Zn-ribbon protein
MTGTGYQDLIDFLGEKFGRLESRLDRIEERLTRVEVLAEHNRHQIQILAEAVVSLNAKVDRLRADMDAEFAAVRFEMDTGFATVRSEMAGGFQTQGKLIKGLGIRVRGLETRWT